MNLIQTSDGVLKILNVQVGFGNLDLPHIIMICVGLGFIALAILKEWEPYELLPIGAGMILANLPLTGLTSQPEPGMQSGMAGVLGIILKYGLYYWTILPQFIFFGIGALTDFSPLIANPRAFLLGAAAQVGIYTSFLGALAVGLFVPEWGFSFPSRRPAPSASSAGRTAPPPSTPPDFWLPISWESPPPRPIPTWPWWPSSSRRSSRP